MEETRGDTATVIRKGYRHCAMAIVAGTMAGTTLGLGTPSADPAQSPPPHSPAPQSPPVGPAPPSPPASPPPQGPPQSPPAALGVFLSSDWRGPQNLPGFESWLRNTVTVGRTYLPGDRWDAIAGAPFVLEPWTRWRAARPGRVLALNVPMVAPNEAGLPDSVVARRLSEGARGEHDHHFRRLAWKLVSSGAGDTIIVLGWEMNGTTYSSRCAPDPPAWKGYWRRIVAAMRSMPGQRFRFDFAPSRGHDAIPWTECYPGDDVVDIIGMDSYDQGPGRGFADYVKQPYGLRAQAEFAARHGKPLSFPEWGLFRRGDRSAYVRRMLDWIGSHNVAYHSISDYCPHGVWQCGANPRSSKVFRDRLRAAPAPVPSPVPSTSSVCAASSSSDLSTSKPPASAAAAAPSAAVSAGCPSLASSASASAPASPGGTSAPVAPVTTSVSPGTAEATSDRPVASASSAVSGSPSQSDGSTTTSAAAYQDLTSLTPPAR